MQICQLGQMDGMQTMMKQHQAKVSRQRRCLGALGWQEYPLRLARLENFRLQQWPRLYLQHRSPKIPKSKHSSAVHVRVLYGFCRSHRRAYKVICDGLNDNKAINIDGDMNFVKMTFEPGGPLEVKKWIISDFQQLRIGEKQKECLHITPQRKHASP